MNKAFIFDLDGVIIDDESIWEEAKKKIYLSLFGQEIYHKMGSTIGINIDGIYERAVQYGSTVPKEKLIDAFYKGASVIYHTAPILPGIEELAETLKEYNYTLGIVSASPREWIDIVVERIHFTEYLSLTLSLFDRPDLLHKPAPDGYIEAIRELGSHPQSTIVLEDSNAGIAAAKAAGAYTIGLKQFLVEGYKQTGADVYAENIEDIIKIVQHF